MAIFRFPAVRGALTFAVAGMAFLVPVAAPGFAVAAPMGQVATTGISTSVSPDLSSRVAELTAPYASPTPPGPGATLDDVRAAAEVSRQVTALLASAGDARGVFGVGLDLVEARAVLPYEEHSSQWARALSANLVYRYLSAVHAEFSGREVPAHWVRYFDLARGGGVGSDANSVDRAALAGYNAHLSVDLALAVADAGSAPVNYGEYLRIVGAIADTYDEIVARTKAVYRIDLAPLWSAVAVPVGPQGRGGVVRIGDQAFSSMSFANGLGMSRPESRAQSRAAADAQWRSVDAAIAAAPVRATF
nr:DUF5995 family protein [Corynebacterium lactis]